MKIPEDVTALLISVAFMLALWLCFAVCNVIWYLLIRSVMATFE